MATLRDGLFPRPLAENLNASEAVAHDWGRAMTCFYRSYLCGRDAVIAEQDIEQLPAGCADGAPRKLPLRHVTETHTVRWR